MAGRSRNVTEHSSPLYAWLAALLRDEIVAGRLGQHEPVPSERTLSERHGVSRMTARHALDTLAREGYVYRDPRRGTFVAAPRLRFGVGSFSHLMSAADLAPGTRVLAAETLKPDAETAGRLGVPAGGHIHVLQRLRTAQGEPVAVEHIEVSAARFPDLLEHDLTGSLWDLLRSQYGVYPSRADARILAIALDQRAAEILGVKVGSPAIILSRTVFDTGGEVVEIARDTYRGDRTEFFVTAPVDGSATEPPA